MTHTSSANVVQQLYNKWYSKSQYDKYWYTWEGKPLILADISDRLTIPRDIRSHFTVRYSWTWDTGEDKWPWIANYPQEPGYVTHNGQRYDEQIIVSTSQHPWSKIGKSYHNGAEPAFDKYGLCKETPQGLYFAEQWTQAFKLHPVMVNITQWNEWMAQRFTINSTSQYDMVRLGATAKFGETYFVDVYNQEFTRDIEPSNEPLIRDHYYLQMVDNATYRVNKNQLMFAVPKSLAGMSRAEVDFDFKWVDNIRQSCVEPLDFYRYGEVAPEARFNYRYKGS